MACAASAAGQPGSIQSSAALRVNPCTSRTGRSPGNRCTASLRSCVMFGGRAVCPQVIGYARQRRAVKPTQGAGTALGRPSEGVDAVEHRVECDLKGPGVTLELGQQ